MNIYHVLVLSPFGPDAAFHFVWKSRISHSLIDDCLCNPMSSYAIKNIPNFTIQHEIFQLYSGMDYFGALRCFVAHS